MLLFMTMDVTGLRWWLRRWNRHHRDERGLHTAREAHTDLEPNANVEGLRMYLNEQGIETRPLWKPMHAQPVFKDCPAYLNGVSEGLFRIGLCIPAGPAVTDDHLRFIVDSIRNAIID